MKARSGVWILYEKDNSNHHKRMDTPPERLRRADAVIDNACHTHYGNGYGAGRSLQGLPANEI